jgi:hypothetical protein
LLKGAVLARWLYDEGEQRTYADSDLLIAPHTAATASAILADLGFDPEPAGLVPGDPELHARSWVRPRDAAIVELHHTLVGVEVPATELWKVLSAATEPMTLRGASVEVLTEPARALHVALHAAQHGKDWTQPMEDLRRAVERVPEEEWRKATALAERLQASEALAAGLRLRPCGSALAERLGLGNVTSPEVALRAVGAPPGAKALERFTRAAGLRARVTMLVRKTFPSPNFIKAWSPLARRSRLGLAAAYAWRPLWLAFHVLSSLPSLLAVKRMLRRRRKT